MRASLPNCHLNISHHAHTYARRHTRARARGHEDRHSYLCDECVQLIRHLAVIGGCGDVDNDATDEIFSRTIARVGHVSVYFNVGIATLEIRRLEAVDTGNKRMAY